jgi:hypothetical protein
VDPVDFHRDFDRICTLGESTGLRGDTYPYWPRPFCIVLASTFTARLPFPGWQTLA